ncbi:MAG TPA: aminopeptidase P family protein [Hellea balneolensis]|uniref:Aminopeptidase P family protein n=1 Tax=Hellea balneolensis TaxID=287478 RepID=A0A7C5LTG1_9PROT|nr:aminopeptidase P family protein [Hellea balneolensis]
MSISKRNFLTASGLTMLGLAAGCKSEAAKATPPKTAANGLKNLTKAAPKITKSDHRARLEKAQSLMQAQGISALFLDVGPSLQYFTGVRWWRSERLTAAIIPVEGEICVVTPHFEEPSIRESLRVKADIRTWNEDENPFQRVVGFLQDKGINSGKIAIEDTVRFFAVDGIQQVSGAYDLVNGTGIVWGCRMYKSAKELALMQIATDITIAAYRHTYPQIEVGMRPSDIRQIMSEATEALGGENDFVLVLLNEASAYPHGSGTPQKVKEGGIVLMDCGASVNGYKSDISRTFVMGEPTKRQREVWNLVRDGQAKAFETAHIGTPAGKVDDAVRALYEANGFGPGYQLPGLPHRTGHGIGMEGHEKINFVHGEATPLAAGMCLSNEPGLYIMGEFGVRLEDCLYMTKDGPKYFSTPPTSIENPMG